MGTYLARRLLLMVPTLVGITFLVFMLIALSPGGIGASLRVSGGQLEASKAAQLEAYLEDRYGLDEPAPVQYLRWLGRVSPVKFGERAQVGRSGELLRMPRAVKSPPLTEWFPLSGPRAATIPDFAAMPVEERQDAYRKAANEYAQARAASRLPAVASAGCAPPRAPSIAETQERPCVSWRDCCQLTRLSRRSSAMPR